jgi:hypothetical protein
VNRRTWWLIALGAVLAVVVSAWVTSQNQPFPGRLDPQNSDPDGAQAVARVLADQGVNVDIARGLSSFDESHTGPDTVVLVTSASQLGRSTVTDLREHAGGSPVIVVDPGPRVVGLLDASGGTFDTSLGDPVEANCSAFEGLHVEVDQGTAYRPNSQSCFQVEAGALLAQPAPGLTLLGAGDLLSNGQILHADNAAVALRLLGQSKHLLWYVPSATDLAAGDEVGLGSLLPTWIKPGLWVVVLSVLALIGWRARRLGRLAIEPLPVTVKAIETALSRGRLYRKANDRAHAADALRGAARVRIADRLQLARDSRPDLLVEAVASVTGRPAHDLHDLLYGAAPASDRSLIQLATTLAELDDQLRKAPR